MIEYFDIDNLNKGAYCVGTFSQHIIDLVNINHQETDILFSKDKIEYTIKHIKEYDDNSEYKILVEHTPDIILHPDYLGLHPTGQSIEFIKFMSKIMVVAIRLKPHGVLWVKTVFPITQDKFNLYESSGSLINFKNS